MDHPTAAAAIAAHRIARVERRTLRRRYPRPIGWNAQGGPHGQEASVNACILTTDQGAVGWGFSGVGEEAAQRFIGRPVAELFDPATGTAPGALTIDAPLHDLAGVILGLPVWRMLGASGGRSIPIYSGAIYFDDLAPGGGVAAGPDGVIAACQADAAAGYAHFKLKIGRGFRYMERAAGDARDVEVTRLVRSRFPQARILVDGNDGYSPEGICRYLEQVADCGLYWIEEPFVETEAGLRLLRAAVDRLSPGTLIADGESRNGRLQEPLGLFGKWQENHLAELYELGGKGLLDVLLMDVSAMGFTAWRRCLPILRQLGIGGSPHAWSEPFKSCYAAQLGCGLGGVPIVEGVPGHVEGVDDSGYVIAGGMITLPETPGFGLRLE
jgi:L-alanine-DL-glutamate epimerase-like enolase superfamily enzyme